jgi:TolB-like protein
MFAKKYLLAFVLFAFTFTLSAQNVKRLDNSIKTVADRTIEQILLRNIPDVFDLASSSRSITVAILDFDCLSNTLSEYVASDLTKYFLGNIKFTIVDRQNLDRAKRELNFNMSLDVNEETAQRIGHFVGAQVVVFGSIKPLGNMYRMQARAITVEKGIVLAQENINIRKRDIKPFIGSLRPSRGPISLSGLKPLEPVEASAVIGMGASFLTSGGTVGWDLMTAVVHAGINLQSSGGFFLNILGDAGAGLGVGFGSYYCGGSVEILLLKYFLIGAGGGMTGANDSSSGDAIIPFSPYVRGSLAFRLFPDTFDQMSIKAFYDYNFDYGFRLGVVFNIFQFFN